MTSDPYRTPDALECPRCHAALVLEQETTHVCPSGCGEWLEIEALAGDQLGESWPGRGGPCARCQKPMEYLTWGKLVSERCTVHGVWVPALHRAAFHEQVLVEREREAERQRAREVRRGVEDAIVDLVVTELADPRELARRIVALEREVAELKKRLT